MGLHSGLCQEAEAFSELNSLRERQGLAAENAEELLETLGRQREGARYCG